MQDFATIHSCWVGFKLSGDAQVLHQRAVFEFDLRQHKTHTEDWQKALLKAGKVEKSVRESYSYLLIYLWLFSAGG